MKLFTGWVTLAGLVLSVAAANAQGLAPYEAARPYTVVSDVEGPYAAMPQEAPMPGYGQPLLAPQEVYAIVRESGFSPLGIPQQRGLFYSIAVVDRGGEDGRLVIDARNGRIVRFMPAYRVGNSYYQDPAAVYAPAPAGPLPPMSNFSGPPRPPVAVPKLASRTPQVPMPKAAPPSRAGDVKPLAEKPAPAPAQQSAAVQAKPTDTPTTPQTMAAPAVDARPVAPPIQPTQAMPKVQGLE